MISSITAVAFDLDGLMFNTEELFVTVGDEVLKRRGKRLTTELLNEMMGRPARVSLQTMIDWHDLRMSISELEDELKELFTVELDERLEPMPGLIDLLDVVEQREYPKAVVTSSSRDYAESLLSRYELTARFQFILTSGDVEHGKPSPDVYQLAADRFDVQPRKMMVLEDSQAGCQAGVSAGAIVVAVPGAHSAHHDFSGVHMRAHSLADPRILDLLG